LLTCINKRLDTVSSKIVLFPPPSTEESNLDIDKSPGVVFLQLIKHSVEDVLHTGILNAIPI